MTPTGLGPPPAPLSSSLTWTKRTARWLAGTLRSLCTRLWLGVVLDGRRTDKLNLSLSELAAAPTRPHPLHIPALAPPACSAGPAAVVSAGSGSFLASEPSGPASRAPSGAMRADSAESADLGRRRSLASAGSGSTAGGGLDVTPWLFKYEDFEFIKPIGEGSSARVGAWGGSSLTSGAVLGLH